MAKHSQPAAANAPDRLQAARIWSITLGISALLLTIMYSAAIFHYGAPHFANPDDIIGELARGWWI